MGREGAMSGINERVELGSRALLDWQRENYIKKIKNKKSDEDCVGYESDLKGNIVSWKTASRETKIVLVDKSRTLYPL